MAGSDHEHVETTVTVERDRQTVYERWRRFEEFPSFMKGVERVERVGENRLHWEADIGFVSREWVAEVVEDRPGEVIAWCAEGEVRNDGRVSFQELSPGRTEVTLWMDYAAEGFVETAGAKLGAVRSRIEGDLGRFKALVEDDGA